MKMITTESLQQIVNTLRVINLAKLKEYNTRTTI